jgi:hydroxyacylglutathione hydrolase
MKIRTYVLLPEFETNTYLIWDTDTKEAILIDVAAPDQGLINDINKFELKLKYLFLTHGHGDHIAGNEMIKNEFNPQIGIHGSDAEMLSDPQKNLSNYWNYNVISPAADIILKDGDSFRLGKSEIKVIHTPGHTRGGVCYLIDDNLFSGDTLFAESVGRTDLPGGDYKTLLKSIAKLFQLPDLIKVYPGHGPQTTLEDEKIGNPFVGILNNAP